MTKKITKINTAIVLIIVAIIILAGWGLRKSFFDFGKTFVASGHPEWPPIMWQQGEEIVGAGPNLVAKIFDDLGLKIDFKYVGLWDEVQAQAKTGEVDVLVAAYKITEREIYMEYSIPYVTDPIALLIKSGKDLNYQQWSDLIGKKGVVTVGDSYGQEFDDYLAANLSVTPVNSVQDALTMIQNSQADYFVYALYSAEKYLAENNLNEQITIVPNYIAAENFYITISKKSPLVKYLSEINELIEKYKKDGTIDKLVENNKKLYLK